jgi:ABC-type uncharacterized transport system permease subunit
VIGKAIGRLLTVAVAFVLALLAGGITLVLVGGRWAADEISAGAGGGRAVYDLLGPVEFAFEVAPALTLLPPILVVAVGEALRIRSALYYIGASGAAAAGMLLASAPYQGETPLFFHSQYAAILATAGFAAGLVYWVVAGRDA